MYKWKLCVFTLLGLSLKLFMMHNSSTILRALLHSLTMTYKLLHGWLSDQLWHWPQHLMDLLPPNHPMILQPKYHGKATDLTTDILFQGNDTLSLQTKIIEYKTYSEKACWNLILHNTQRKVTCDIFLATWMPFYSNFILHEIQRLDCSLDLTCLTMWQKTQIIYSDSRLFHAWHVNLFLFHFDAISV